MELLVTVKSKADQSIRTVRQPLNGRLLLGRGPDSAVPLEAPGISREHLEVQAENSSLILTDLSSNGTWLNGSRMPPRRKCRISETDVVELPGFELHLQMAGSNRAAASPSSSVPASAAPARLPAGRPASRSESILSTFSALDILLFVVALASGSLFFLYMSW